jgi:hypothetical protein
VCSIDPLEPAAISVASVPEAGTHDTEYVRRIGSPNDLRWWMNFAKYYASLVRRPDGDNTVSRVTETVKRRRARRPLG